MNEETKKGIVEILNTLENHFLVFGFAILIVVGFLQVVMRTVFNNSLSWSEELIRYIYIWLCWVGVSLAQRRGEHIQLTFIADLLPKKVQKVLGILVSILLIVFTIWLVYMGFTLTAQVAASNARSTALRIPMFIVYAAFPMGNLFYCLRIIGLLVKQVKDIKKEEK